MDSSCSLFHFDLIIEYEWYDYPQEQRSLQHAESTLYSLHGARMHAPPGPPSARQSGRDLLGDVMAGDSDPGQECAQNFTQLFSMESKGIWRAPGSMRSLVRPSADELGRSPQRIGCRPVAAFRDP